MERRSACARGGDGGPIGCPSLSAPATARGSALELSLAELANHPGEALVVVVGLQRAASSCRFGFSNWLTSRSTDTGATWMTPGRGCAQHTARAVVPRASRCCCEEGVWWPTDRSLGCASHVRRAAATTPLAQVEAQQRGIRRLFVAPGLRRRRWAAGSEPIELTIAAWSRYALEQGERLGRRMVALLPAGRHAPAGGPP